MAPILFTAATLTALSGRAVTDEQAAAIHAWVVTALEGEIGVLSDPAPPGVTGVAVELGIDAVPAPGGAASTSLGSFSTTYTTGAAGKDRPFSIDTTQAAEVQPASSATTPLPVSATRQPAQRSGSATGKRSARLDSERAWSG